MGFLPFAGEYREYLTQKVGNSHRKRSRKRISLFCAVMPQYMRGGRKERKRIVKMKVLAVIPARGGSKGIPRKNVRIMANKPLIAYSIENALSCPLVTHVAVSTDDEEIRDISLSCGAQVIMRGAHLALDHVTLDPVVFDAVQQAEAAAGKFDIVITMQPTSPLLTAATLTGALEAFIAKGQDTVLSVTNRPHLSWSFNGTRYFPLYEKRLNRQQLPPNFLETGAFVITRRENVRENSRFGKEVSVYEIPESEAVDIDTVDDWLIAERALSKKTIVFRVDGYRRLGLGHIYRCLTLAYAFMGHDVCFVTKEEAQEGLARIQASFFPYVTVKNEEEFFAFLAEKKPDIIINDLLDTEVAYMRKLKSLCKKLVSFEDLGPGRLEAHLVVNALYQEEQPPANTLCGEKYLCLRDEFVCAAPAPFSEEAARILVLFGGADPAGLTEKIYRLARRLNGETNNRFSFTFVLGSAYPYEDSCVRENAAENITVLRDVKRMTALMQNAHLAFTSQGRTVFELAAMGVPSIVLAQNEREQLHTFANMSNGFLNLGLGENVDENTLHSTFMWLAGSPQIRREMRKLMLKRNLRAGTGRVISKILE